MKPGQSLPNIRRNTSAEAKSQTEILIRQARHMLRQWHVDMSHNRIVKHVRRYERSVVGFTFFDYFANAIKVDEQHRREAKQDLDSGVRLSHADPTANEAVRRVAKEGR